MFTRQITLLLSDEEYRELQIRLLADPALGSVVRGSGGIRKVRVGVARRGKSGGARILYYWQVQRNLVVLLFAYAKNETEDLTKAQVAQLAKYIREEFGHEGRVV